MKRILPVSIVLALTLSAGSSPAQRSSSAFPLHVGSVQVVGRDAGLGTFLAARVGPSGAVYAIDYENARVVAFSPEGRLLWRSGRKGRGPGEFQLPYRIDVRPDGNVLVFDHYTGEVTALSPDGRFVARYTLPFRFDQVDNLAALPGGQIAIAGTTHVERRARASGIHRFAVDGPRLKYLGSFAPLPTVRDSLVLRSWGAGALARTARGELLFARRIPYEIHRFDATGRALGVLRPPFRARGTPDDAVRIERDERGVTTSEGTDVERPGVLTELMGGWVLATRVSRRGTFWDLYSPTGRYMGSRSVSQEWGFPAGFDPSRGVLWMAGSVDDEPVLRRVRVSL